MSGDRTCQGDPDPLPVGTVEADGKRVGCRGLDFSSPTTIARYYMEDMRHRNREVLKLLLLNTRSRLIGETNVSIGTVDMALVSPRELFIEAIQKNASSIILLHNHPSGDPTPSKEDVRITRRVHEAGMMIGIELLDHIIIGNNCFISLKEKGFFQQRGADRRCKLIRGGLTMAGKVYGLDLGTYEIKVFDKKQDKIWREKDAIAMKNKNIYLP